MREIKFRAALKFNDGFILIVPNVTVYPDMIGFSYDTLSEILPNKYQIIDDGIYFSDEDNFELMCSLLSGEDWFWAEQSEPMQYTGITDKNGKEIYEGDIVQINSTMIGGKIIIGEIIFNMDNTLSNLEWGLWTSRGYHSTDFLGEIKLIGNIYENPELLEDK